MSCTIEKALADAKALVERLREHDSAAEALIEQTTALNKRVEAMKQYQEEIQELNEVARHRPRSTLVMGIQQENRQIRELQQENKELRTSLEEHQSALELIMSKYREQMFRLLMASKKDDPSIIMKLKEQHSKELQVHVDQITEMAAVMRKAIEVDERHGCKEQERITQLEQENKGLREILQITRESFLNLKKEDASESTSLSGLVTSILTNHQESFKCDNNTEGKKHPILPSVSASIQLPVSQHSFPELEKLPAQSLKAQAYKRKAADLTDTASLSKSVSKKAYEKTKNSKSSEEYFGRESTYKKKEEDSPSPVSPPCLRAQLRFPTNLLVQVWPLRQISTGKERTREHHCHMAGTQCLGLTLMALALMLCTPDIFLMWLMSTISDRGARQQLTQSWPAFVSTEHSSITQNHLGTGGWYPPLRLQRLPMNCHNKNSKRPEQPKTTEQDSCQQLGGSAVTAGSYFSLLTKHRTKGLAQCPEAFHTPGISQVCRGKLDVYINQRVVQGMEMAVLSTWPASRARRYHVHTVCSGRRTDTSPLSTPTPELFSDGSPLGSIQISSDLSSLAQVLPEMQV
ncbi:hypothetical protein IHE44_0011936, partial [Lamprotornis superbus]